MSPRTYFITGSSRGIGVELVEQLAAKGNIVIASARNPEAAEKLQKLVDNKKVFAVKLDVQSEESVKAAVEKVNEISPDGIDVSGPDQTVFVNYPVFSLTRSFDRY